MAITLNLAKTGEDLSQHKIALNLHKTSKFVVELYWDSPDDLDAHALLAKNSGNGAKITAAEQILSTFNCDSKDHEGGALKANADGSFNTPEGSLRHSGDCRDGVVEDVDESITINGALIPADVNEIPIFVTIYPAGNTKFANVTKAGIRIKDDAGKVLGEFELSNEFGEFDAVQMGSLILDDSGWHFCKVGSGFNGDFQSIIDFFAS